MAEELASVENNTEETKEENGVGTISTNEKRIESISRKENVEEKCTDEKNSEENRAREISFDVHMNKDVLYDYMVHHAYTGAGGILGTCFGFMGVLGFFQADERNWLLLIIGLLLIFYLPVNLKYKSFMQMKLTDEFKKPLHYEIGKEGIEVSQGENRQNISWDQCYKAVSTRLSIVVYTGKRNASVFPRKDLGDHLSSLIAVISENMDPKKVKIRF